MPPLEPEPPERELEEEPDEPEEPPDDPPEEELGMPPPLDDEDCCSTHPPTRKAETAPTSVVCIASESSRFNDGCLRMAAPLSADSTPIQLATARRTLRPWS